MDVTKIGILVNLIMKLWGKEIFEYLEKEAADTSTKLDDWAVAGMRKYFLDD